MKVKAKFHSLLRLWLEVDEIEVELQPEGATVRGLIGRLSERLGRDLGEELFEGRGLRPGTMVLVNGRNVFHLKGLDTPLQDGDQVVFFPPGGGG